MSFNPGDLVLTKLKGFPLWPSRIVPGDRVPDKIKSIRPKTSGKKQSGTDLDNSVVCVKFLGDDNYIWTNVKDLKMLSPETVNEFLKKKNEDSNETFIPKKKNALVQAYLLSRKNLPLEEFINFGSFGEPEEIFVEEPVKVESISETDAASKPKARGKKKAASTTDGKTKESKKRKTAAKGQEEEEEDTAAKGKGRKRAKKEEGAKTATAAATTEEKTKGKPGRKPKGKTEVNGDAASKSKSKADAKPQLIKAKPKPKPKPVEVEVEDPDWGLDTEEDLKDFNQLIPADISAKFDNSAVLAASVEQSNKVSNEFRIYLQNTLLISPISIPAVTEGEEVKKENDDTVLNKVKLTELSSSSITSIEGKIAQLINQYPKHISKISLKTSNLVKVISNILKKPEFYASGSKLSKIHDILSNFLRDNYYSTKDLNLFAKVSSDFLSMAFEGEKRYGDSYNEEEDTEENITTVGATPTVESSLATKEQTPITA